MKNKTYLTLAVTALTFVTLTAPARAADNDDKSKAANNPNPNASSLGASSGSMASSTGFGRIERANRIIGKSVLTSDNQKNGKINNVVVDLETGRVLYAVVSLGGVAGIGSTDVAVPPGAFHNETPQSVSLSLDKQKLEGAPKFDSNVDKPDQLGQASYVSQVYQYFGQSPWWQGASPANVGSFHNVHKINDLIGMNVLDVNNQNFAKVNNFMIDLADGRVAYVVITPASSLNLGNNLYALAPSALTLSSDQKNLVTGITKEKLASAPHFDNNGWATLANPSYAAQIYNYYGKQPYFGNGLQPTGR